MADRPKCIPPSKYRPEDVMCRSTFLYRLTDPVEVDALKTLGRMLCDSLNETGKWGPWGIQGVVPAQLLAAADDLQELANFLSMVGAERHEAPAGYLENRLCTQAESWAGMVADVAQRIRVEVVH